MICAPILWAPEMTRSPEREACVAVDVEAAGRAAYTLPEVGVSRAFSLPRARGEVGLHYGDLAGARVAVAAVRTGGDDGYLGIDGETIVAAVVVAEARVAAPRIGIGAGAGLIDDPWTVGSEHAFGLRDLGASWGEEYGIMDRSDLGAWLGWTSPSARLAVRLDLSTGEGAHYRERNDGKNIAGSITARPFASDELVVSVYAREGSRGLALARDHRLGARVSGGYGPVEAGVEALAAFGAAGDATRAPMIGSLWVEARPWGPLLAFGRIDLATEDLTDAEAGTRVARAGLGVEVFERRGRVVVGWEGRAAGGHVVSVAGAEALTREDTLYVQLSVDIGVAAPIRPPDLARDTPPPPGGGTQKERVDE